MAGPRDHTLTFSGAGVQEFQAVGRYLRVREATGSIFISIDSNTELERAAGEQIDIGSESSRVRVRSTTAQTVKIVTAKNPQNDDRATINATVNTTIEPSDTVNNPGDVTALSTPVLAIAANANRKEVELCLPSTATNPVRVGNASVTASSGSILEPGTSKTFGITAALYVIRTASPDEAVTVLELERP